MLVTATSCGATGGPRLDADAVRVAGLFTRQLVVKRSTQGACRYTEIKACGNLELIISGNVESGVTRIICRGHIIRCSIYSPSGSSRGGDCVSFDLRGQKLDRGYLKRVVAVLDMTLRKHHGSWKVSTFDESFSYRIVGQ